jgi:hypothetical protein
MLVQDVRQPSILPASRSGIEVTGVPSEGFLLFMGSGDGASPVPEAIDLTGIDTEAAGYSAGEGERSLPLEADRPAAGMVETLFRLPLPEAAAGAAVSPANEIAPLPREREENADAPRIGGKPELPAQTLGPATIPDVPVRLPGTSEKREGVPGGTLPVGGERAMPLGEPWQGREPVSADVTGRAGLLGREPTNAEVPRARSAPIGPTVSAPQSPVAQMESAQDGAPASPDNQPENLRINPASFAVPAGGGGAAVASVLQLAAATPTGSALPPAEPEPVPGTAARTSGVPPGPAVNPVPSGEAEAQPAPLAPVRDGGRDERAPRPEARESGSRDKPLLQSVASLPAPRTMQPEPTSQPVADAGGHRSSRDHHARAEPVAPRHVAPERSGGAADAGAVPRAAGPVPAEPSPPELGDPSPRWLAEPMSALLPLPAADEAATRRAADIVLPAGAPPAAETARSVAAQLAASAGAAAAGESRIEIQLSPEELGRVTLTLQVADDTVVMSIQAERQETLDLMRRHADMLQREFRDAGFTAMSFSFGQGSPDGRATRPTLSPVAEDDSAVQQVATGAPSRPDRPAPSSRLDLRL